MAPFASRWDVNHDLREPSMTEDLGGHGGSPGPRVAGSNGLDAMRAYGTHSGSQESEALINCFPVTLKVHGADQVDESAEAGAFRFFGISPTEGRTDGTLPTMEPQGAATVGPLCGGWHNRHHSHTMYVEQ